MSESTERPTSQQMVAKSNQPNSAKVSGRPAFVVIEVLNDSRKIQLSKNVKVYIDKVFGSSFKYFILDCQDFLEANLANCLISDETQSDCARKQFVMSSFANFINLYKHINRTLDQGISVIAFNYEAALRSASNWVFSSRFSTTCFEGAVKPDRIIVVHGCDDVFDELETDTTTWLYAARQCIEECLESESEDTQSDLFGGMVVYAFHRFDNSSVTRIPKSSSQDYMLQLVNQVIETSLLVAKNMPQDLYPRLFY